MGADKNERGGKRVPSGKLNLKTNNTTNGHFSWSDVDAEELAELVRYVTIRGGAIRFGLTRDGGAGAVGVYYGDSRDTVYIRPGEDVALSFQIIYSAFRDFPETGGRSPTA